jgi:hypothetical protein
MPAAWVPNPKPWRVPFQCFIGDFELLVRTRYTNFESQLATPLPMTMQQLAKHRTPVTINGSYAQG